MNIYASLAMMSCEVDRMSVRDGYKMTDLGEIPVEWSVRQISDYYNVNAESLSNSTDPNLEIEYIDIESVNDGKITGTKKMRFEDAPSRARRIVKFGDVIVSTVRPYLKAFAQIDQQIDNLVCSTGFAVVNSKNSIKSCDDYIAQFVFSEIFVNQLTEKMVGSNYPAVNSSDIKMSLIILPEIPEQRKIADILSTVDEHISETESLIEKTKVLKRAMMQQLLTKGIGHTEFKDTEIGRIPVEWEVLTLAALGSTYGGLSGKSKDDFGDGSPFITYKSIFDSSIVDLSRVEYVQIKIGERQNKAQKGDLFFTTSSETPYEVGMCSALLTEVDNLYLNSFCFGYRIFDQSVFDTNFARYLFRGSSFRSELSKLAQGSTRFNLSKNAMLKILIPLPNHHEQQQIASILTAIDDQIDTFQTKLTALTKLKSALMQQLLTGKIRVKI